jgi:beta-galactosidase
MDLAGCNTFAIGIFAWTSYEPKEGEYDFGWLDRMMDRLAAAGHKAVLATPSGAKPAWLSHRYPEVRRVNKAGLREPHSGRHNHCWNSPVYRQKVAAIDRQLAKRYHGHPALGMWHISNEFSGECYCELCLAAWQRWLEARYGTVEALNDAWWTPFWSHSFTSFEQVDPRDGSVDALLLDHRRFSTDQVIDFVRWEIAALREFSPDVPCTTNYMGLFPWIDYAKIAEELDLVADDQYPRYAPDDELERSVLRVSFKDDLHRCFKPDRPWMLMESCPDAPQHRHPVRLKRPGLHQAEMLQALGHGAEGTCYFQWRKGRGGCEKLHGAVVDHVGHEHTRVFKEVAGLGVHYAKLAAIVGSTVPSQVALLYDWDVRWGFESSEGTRSKEDAYEHVAVEHHRALARHGVAVDVLSSERDFSAYKLVVAPQLWLLKPGVAERIAQFVRGGGTLIATYYTGVCDETNRCFTGGAPGAGLMPVFGIWNEETEWLPQGATRGVETVEEGLGLGSSYRAAQVCAIVHLRGARALARYTEDFFRGTPALTENRFGAGTAYYQAAWLGPEFLSRFYADLVQRLGVERALEQELPDGVHVQRRVKDDREFLFVQNFSESSHTLRLTKANAVDLLQEQPLTGMLELPAWGSTVVSSRR